jgi:hypothetical protein
MTNSTTLAEKLNRDQFLVKQRHRAWMKSKYYVFDEQGAPLFYVERPVKPLRRSDITIYDDDTCVVPLLLIRQDHGYAAIRREYTLLDASTQEPIAHLERHNIKSWFRREWEIRHPEGHALAAAREDTVWLAAVRRVFEWVPYAGVIVGFIRTNFQIYAADPAGAETRVGAFNRQFSLGDKYKLDLSGDPQRLFDRRIALALGIMLDTGEAR